jgi:lipopolysaccharide export system permease protein
MTVAFRHVAREVMAVFAVATLVLLLIAVGSRFISYLQDAALGRYAAESVLVLLLYRMPEFLELTLPFAFFLAAVLVTGRLWAEQELTVLTAGGTSPMRVLGWMLIAGALVATCVALLTLNVAPRAGSALAEFVLKERVSREFESITPGVFHTQNDGDRVIYAEDISSDRQALLRVFVAERRDNASDITIWAERGRQYVSRDTGSRFIELQQGRRYEGTAGQLRFRVAEFGSLSQRIETNSEIAGRSKQGTLPTAMLDTNDPQGAAEWHWRIALPVMTLVSVVFGFGLARTRPREGRFARIVPTVTAFIMYYLVLLLNQNALAEGRLPTEFGLWPTHAAFLLLGMIAVHRVLLPVRT